MAERRPEIDLTPPVAALLLNPNSKPPRPMHYSRRRAYQAAGNQRHGRTEPKGYNAHYEREKRKRKRRTEEKSDPEPTTLRGAVKRMLRAASGSAPGHPLNQDEKALADLCGRWMINRLSLDPSHISAEWGPRAAKMSAWGEFIPSTGEIRLASNHPDLISLLWTTIHESVHAKDAQDGTLPPKWKRDESETERLERETDKRTANLLDEFLSVVDTGTLRENGIRSLDFDDIFPHTEPVAA